MRASRLYGLISLLAAPLLAKDPAWVVLGPNGQIIARTITANATCPQIKIDGTLSDMTVRAPQTPPAFTVTSCEAVIPPGAKKASIDGRRLVLPVADPKRLIIIGDTGCRLKAKKKPGKFKVQDCESGKTWPFRKLARQAADWKPQLVIHVGDYVYREIACPYSEKCDSSPFGDSWVTWQADFFAPGAPLLAAAPWVMVRGNHEDCHRAGAGFFRFLETTVIDRSSPIPPPCREYTDPYAVPMGDVTLLMLDSSAVKPLKPGAPDDEEEEDEGEADTEAADPSQLQIYTRQFTELWGMAGANNWLLMHHPLRAAREGKADDENFIPLTDTIWTAAGDVPNSIDLAVTGHIHLTEVLTFDGHPTSQIVLGAGGTELLKDVPRKVKGHEIGGWTVATTKFIHDFGYATVEKKGTNKWSMRVYGTNGSPQMTCSVDGAQVECTKD